ncbi:MAG: hypothetical protein CXT67_02035 [Methanobacteriota archaeon]|jgi:adenylate kinase|nr:MAG: hypothetical protein CXT67_02035 [Euryarchaeota archaeon]HIG20802.1 hypothetical protein [Candidatus Poseidoniales archaeon]
MTITTNPYMMSGTCAHRIAITGTPGSGKTSVAEFGLANSNGDWPLSIISDKELAEKNGFLGKIDSNDGAQPIDVEQLVSTLSEQWAQPPKDDTLIDGHLSHLLPVDAVVIIRCNPEVLQTRMQDRGWSKSKIDENAEWELLGAAWNDEHEWGNTPVLELDSTETSVDSLFTQIEAWTRDGFKPESPEQRIDWITVLHGE